MNMLCFSVALLGLVAAGTGFQAGTGDGERLERLKLEVADFQQDLLQDSLEIQEWNIKLEKLKEDILELKKEKQLVQSQGKM